jgi:putative membrane protein
MQKRAFFLISIVGFVLQSCTSNDRGGRDAAATSAIDRVADTTQRTQIYTADVDINGDEKSFIFQAAAGSLEEIASGNLILQASSNSSVKAFAKRWMKDQRKASMELEKIATTKGLTLPSTLSEQQLKDVAGMKALSGRPLDVQYVTMIIDNHAKTEEIFGKATSFKDVELKNFALNTLPIMQTHHKDAVELGKKLNISNTNNGDDLGSVSTSKNH